MSSVDHEIEALETRLFLEAVHARYGYDLRGYSPASLHRRVRLALARTGTSHLGQLQHRVLTEPDFFADVLEDLTVRVSDLFRDPGFFRVFRERVIPVLRTYPLINLWHAGCATGEEAYSAAVLLAEQGLAARAQIYATDLSPRALEHAKQGLYPAQHLAAMAARYQEAGGGARLADYYTAAYDRIAFKESLRSKILFFQHDLVSDHVFGEMQVIFCRNVLIYFGPELRARVLAKFAQSLCPGGFLCLGASERLPRQAEAHFAEFAPEQSIYRQVA